ncbi:MAG: hypothetical protein ACD_45C00557G0001 [uncultured bacterium]|nr:MAG: hypothetical protein ACD_45C00557G0001 [uncultured bacterium]
MKLRNQILIGSSVICAAFLALIYIEPQILVTSLASHHYYLIALVIASFLLSFLFIWKFVIKRLEKLNRDVRKINQNQLMGRVEITGNDELATLAKQINNIVHTAHISQTTQERINQLEKINAQLQHELTTQESMVKELIDHKKYLLHLAHYDPVTALPNRIFFNEMLNKTIHHASRHKKMMAILFIDIDHFKNINDVFGHTVGDAVLKEIANRFSSILRSGDILARLGGDEFIVLLNDITHPKFANLVAEKLLKASSQSIKMNQHEILLTTSIGICIYPNDGVSLEDLQKNADTAMYKAKRGGGGIAEYFTKDAHIAMREHIQSESALQKAMTHNEFLLYYQPQFNLQNGTITGVEALIRWENPELGLLRPAEFMPLAEKTGFIIQIGEWVLREACKTNKLWQKEGYKPITLAVNLSPKQFQHPDIIQIIANILAETSLDPNYLQLEIPAHIIMDYAEETIHKLNTIKNLGVKISLDDFSAGSVSVPHFKKLPIHSLKIDQAIITEIPENQNNIVITNAIITLAHNLGIKVIAEGVETTEQLQYLASHHCDIVQGYYLSRPLPQQKMILQLSKTADALT